MLPICIMISYSIDVEYISILDISHLIIFLEGGFVVVFVFGLSFVFHVGDVARITINVVVDDLTTTIGKNDVVLSSDLISLMFLVVAHIDVEAVVFHGVVEIVQSWGLSWYRILGNYIVLNQVYKGWNESYVLRGGSQVRRHISWWLVIVDVCWGSSSESNSTQENESDLCSLKIIRI